MPEGTIYIGKEYTIKKSKDETIDMIKSLGYNVDYYKNLEDSITIKNIGQEKYHIIKPITSLFTMTTKNQLTQFST